MISLNHSHKYMNEKITYLDIFYIPMYNVLILSSQARGNDTALAE